VAAGNSLFNVVVDTDETAAKLLKKLEDRNLGRVCFMPLNRLRVKAVAYPDSADVVPLLKAALTYPKEVRACRNVYVCVSVYVYVSMYV
jgi:structural maintenance of chromosome 3 (chondroitin sulfate proteoglycan 6)